MTRIELLRIQIFNDSFTTLLILIVLMQLFPRKENLFRFENSCRSTVQSYVLDIQRRFERGNHDADDLDYIAFRLDWVINLLERTQHS